MSGRSEKHSMEGLLMLLNSMRHTSLRGLKQLKQSQILIRSKKQTTNNLKFKKHQKKSYKSKTLLKLMKHQNKKQKKKVILKNKSLWNKMILKNKKLLLKKLNKINP